MTMTKKSLPAKASNLKTEESFDEPRKTAKETLFASATAKKSAPLTSQAERRVGPTTRITIQYDVGFSNSMYVRGKGAALSWEKGVPLKNTQANEWVWETTAPFTTCEFKVLINDQEYEIGDNHLLTCGALIHYTPKFH